MAPMLYNDPCSNPLRHEGFHNPNVNFAVAPNTRTVVGFAEGVLGKHVGIIGAPMVLSWAAERGLQAVLIVGGRGFPGWEHARVSNVDEAFSRKQGYGTFGVLTAKAWTRWFFSPSLLWKYGCALQRADLVILNSLYSFPVLAGYLLARCYRKPYAIWPHGVLAPFMRKVSIRKKWLYNRLIADRIVRSASVIVYTAEGERKETAELGFRTPSVVIPTGLDTSEFASLPQRGRFRARFLNGDTGPLVLFLARLHAKKGLDILIQAMRSVIIEKPGARLAIVGPPDPDSFHDQVMQWIKGAGIESQTAVTGAADPAMRLEAFADADLYVLPSFEENFGLSAFEAMASGLPVVVSDTLNYAGEIAASGAGLAVARTPENFAFAISALLDDPKRRREMGICGLQLAQKYSPEETSVKVGKLVRSIVEGNPLPQDLLPLIPDKS